MELVARRLYGEVFFGGTVSDEREQVQKDLAKGVRTLSALAKFSSIAGKAAMLLIGGSGAAMLGERTK